MVILYDFMGIEWEFNGIYIYIHSILTHTPYHCIALHYIILQIYVYIYIYIYMYVCE